jgi:tetratricopeptide (TPR) repeat protein
MVYGAKRQFAEAIASYEKAIKLGDDTAANLGFYAYPLAQAGHRQQARRILRRMQQSHEFVPAATLAIAFAGLGHKERASGCSKPATLPETETRCSSICWSRPTSTS